MDPITLLIIVAIVLGFYVAWNIGANDVANAVGTSVGSGALSLKQAVLIAAVFEFCGAFFLGSNVSETVEGGIVDLSFFTQDTSDYVYGMMAALLAAGIWLQIASFFGWPVSTTHSIVGGVVGFGLVTGGPGAIYWGKMGSIFASWVISPLLGGAIAYFIFMIMRRKILYSSRPVRAAKKSAPYLVFSIFFILSLIIFFGGLSGLDLHLNPFEALGIAVAVGFLAALISFFLVRRLSDEGPPSDSEVQAMQVAYSLRKIKKHMKRLEASAVGNLNKKAHDLLDEVDAISKTVVVKEEYERGSSEYRLVERIFIYLQIITACFMAFAHGSNDVANAIGPLAAVFNILHGHSIMESNTVPLWLLLLGGVGIIIGLATWGWRVIETVGRKITELTPSRGFAAGFAAAITIVFASKLGLPISTTHVLVGAVLGVGFARGFGAINLTTIRDIVLSWIVTVPAGALLAIIFFYAFRTLFS